MSLIRDLRHIIRHIPRSGLAWCWITVIGITIDRYTKWWMIHHLHLFQSKMILPFLNFTLVHNKGAAFAFLHTASGWQNLTLGTIALAMSMIMIIWLYRLKVRSYWECIALNFILTGAVGNVLDRILYGYVIDFLDFHIGRWHFAIFNLADSAICLGAFILLCFFCM